MQQAKPTGQQRKAAAIAQVAVKSAEQSDGLVEIAILSLAGLTLSAAMLAQGMFADVLPLLAW
jgi:hypothetical protein